MGAQHLLPVRSQPAAAHSMPAPAAGVPACRPRQKPPAQQQRTHTSAHTNAQRCQDLMLTGCHGAATRPVAAGERSPETLLNAAHHTGTPVGNALCSTPQQYGTSAACERTQHTCESSVCTRISCSSLRLPYTGLALSHTAASAVDLRLTAAPG